MTSKNFASRGRHYAFEVGHKISKVRHNSSKFRSILPKSDKNCSRSQKHNTPEIGQQLFPKSETYSRNRKHTPGIGNILLKSETYSRSRKHTPEIGNILPKSDNNFSRSRKHTPEIGNILPKSETYSRNWKQNLRKAESVMTNTWFKTSICTLNVDRRSCEFVYSIIK